MRLGNRTYRFWEELPYPTLKLHNFNIQVLSRGVIFQRVFSVSAGTPTNRPRATEQRLPSGRHCLDDFVAQVQPMPLCPDGVVTIENCTPRVVWVRPIIRSVDEAFCEDDDGTRWAAVVIHRLPHTLLPR